MKGVIPDNTGIISLNDLYLAMRHGVLFKLHYPKSGLITATMPIYNHQAIDTLHSCKEAVCIQNGR